MDKVTKQRDPKRQAAGRKGHENYMDKLKEDILKNVGSSNSTNGGINTTNDSSTTSITNFSYIHGVGAIAVLALGACIFIIPKLMTNQTTHHDLKIKAPKRYLKNPKRSLKSDGKCYNKTR